ncbi:hypothetical protein IJV57_00055 [Candidatus Saccharibacteria bacterium]|nr:hypothetical protein [Candidatus Saccharibacteria bacterium]
MIPDLLEQGSYQKEISEISGWDVQNVTNMSYMFCLRRRHKEPLIIIILYTNEQYVSHILALTVACR